MADVVAIWHVLAESGMTVKVHLSGDRCAKWKSRDHAAEHIRLVAKNLVGWPRKADLIPVVRLDEARQAGISGGLLFDKDRNGDTSLAGGKLNRHVRGYRWHACVDLKHSVHQTRRRSSEEDFAHCIIEVRDHRRGEKRKRICRPKFPARYGSRCQDEVSASSEDPDHASNLCRIGRRIQRRTKRHAQRFFLTVAV